MVDHLRVFIILRLVPDEYLYGMEAIYTSDRMEVLPVLREMTSRVSIQSMGTREVVIEVKGQHFSWTF